MKKPRKIAILALICLLSAQISTAFAVTPMAGAGHHAMVGIEQQPVQLASSAHHHGHADMQAAPHAADCLESGTDSEHHQAMDCEDNCMDCVNHCSSVGIQSNACNFVDYAHRTTGTSDHAAFFRIDNPFRPPILA